MLLASKFLCQHCACKHKHKMQIETSYIIIMVIITIIYYNSFNHKYKIVVCPNSRKRLQGVMLVEKCL